MQTVIINPGAAVTAIRTAKVNGLTATFFKKEANVWQAQVKEAVNGRYEVTGTAVDSSGSWPLWIVKYYGVSLITDRTQADLDNDTARAVSTTPRTPASITYSSINQANEIEQILADLYQLINGMESQYRYSGEAIAGEE